MQITQYATELPPPIACPCLCHPACAIEAWHIPFFFQHLSYRAPFNEVCDQVISTILDKIIMTTSNAGVIEVQQESRLTLEPFYLLATLSLVLKFIQHLLTARGRSKRISIAR